MLNRCIFINFLTNAQHTLYKNDAHVLISEQWANTNNENEIYWVFCDMHNYVCVGNIHGFLLLPENPKPADMLYDTAHYTGIGESKLLFHFYIVSSIH